MKPNSKRLEYHRNDPSTQAPAFQQDSESVTHADDPLSGSNRQSNVNAERRPADPRAALISSLARSVADLGAAGDIAGARIATEALSRLLATADGGACPVVDLAGERAKRGT